MVKRNLGTKTLHRTLSTDFSATGLEDNLVTLLLNSLEEALDTFDIAVLDQWGVLHNGSQPYPHAGDAMRTLKVNEKELLILSNSGKRADLNLLRLQEMGFPVETISKVITSGETLWEDVNEERLKVGGKTPKKIFPISAQKNDPVQWAGDSGKIEITFELDETVDVFMLMGIPDGTTCDAFDTLFDQARQFQTPLICSNPDKTSPRAGGLVISPGALAQRYADMGGEVIWCGKPQLPIFRAVARSFPELPANRFLMVGDSLEHDIAGAQRAGMKSAFIRGGIHAGDFSGAKSNKELSQVTDKLVAQHGLSAPSYSLEFLA